MVVTDRVQGILLGVSINGTQLNCETEAEFSYTIEMLPATNPQEARWRGTIPGVQSWDITVSGNLLLEAMGADFKTLLVSARAGERVRVGFGTIPGVSPAFGVEGYAYPSRLSLGGRNVDLALWSVTFQGDRAFRITGDNPSGVINRTSLWPEI